MSDAGLAHFKDCKNLDSLQINSTRASDAGLAHFKGMPLRRLVINNTGITDLTPLQGMPLEEIRLTPKNITRGLDILRDMKSLKTIGIDWEPILAGGGILGALRQGGVQAWRSFVGSERRRPLPRSPTPTSSALPPCRPPSRSRRCGRS